VKYERGTGVKKDVARALGWYALAARAGSKPAIDRLAVLVPALEGPKAPERTVKPAIETAPAPPQAALQVPNAQAPTSIVPTPAPAATAIPVAPAQPSAPTIAPPASAPVQAAPQSTQSTPPAVDKPEGGAESETATVPQEGQVAPEPWPPVFQNPEISEPYKF